MLPVKRWFPQMKEPTAGESANFVNLCVALQWEHRSEPSGRISEASRV